MPRVEISLSPSNAKKGSPIAGHRGSIKLDGIEVNQDTRSFFITAGVDEAATIELNQFVTQSFRFVAPDPHVYLYPMVPEGMALAEKTINGTKFYYGIRIEDMP